MDSLRVVGQQAPMEVADWAVRQPGELFQEHLQTRAAATAEACRRAYTTRPAIGRPNVLIAEPHLVLALNTPRPVEFLKPWRTSPTPASIRANWEHSNLAWNRQLCCQNPT